MVLVALGFDLTGAKHLLGIHEGATENRESCKALLAKRGIDSGRSTLFVLDGAKALRRAVLDVFGKRAGDGFRKPRAAHQDTFRLPIGAELTTRRKLQRWRASLRWTMRVRGLCELTHT